MKIYGVFTLFIFGLCIMRLASWFGLSVLSILFLLSIKVSAATIYISSEEASGINETGQLQADTLDDYRKNGFSSSSNLSNTNYQVFQFSQTGNVGTAYLDMTYNQINANSITTRVSLRNVTGSDLRGLVHETSFPSISDASFLQDTAPKPFSLLEAYFRNEESAGSTTSKNGILFEFSEPVIGFGARFGDIETRTDGTGIAAEVRLFDNSGNLINSSIIIPTITDQSTCGGTTQANSPSACGNETTRFIGFADPNKQVVSMLVVIGDDDAGDDGFREHLSFIGPTMALQITNGMCNNTISGHNFTIGSLPSTEFLCSSGIINNLIQGTTGWNRSCQGVNLGTTTNCSFNIITNTGTTNTGTTNTGTTNTGTTNTGTTNTGTTNTGTTNTGTTNTGTTNTGTTNTGTTNTGTTNTGTTNTGTTNTGTTNTGTTNTGTTNTGTTIIKTGTNYTLPTKILAPGGIYEPQPLPTPIFQTISNIKQKTKRMIQLVIEKTEHVILPQALPDTGIKIKRILEIVFSSLIGY